MIGHNWVNLVKPETQQKNKNKNKNIYFTVVIVAMPSSIFKKYQIDYFPLRNCNYHLRHRLDLRESISRCEIEEPF